MQRTPKRTLEHMIHPELSDGSKHAALTHPLVLWGSKGALFLLQQDPHPQAGTGSSERSLSSSGLQNLQAGALQRRGTPREAPWPRRKGPKGTFSTQNFEFPLPLACWEGGIPFTSLSPQSSCSDLHLPAANGLRGFHLKGFPSVSAPVQMLCTDTLPRASLA